MLRDARLAPPCEWPRCVAACMADWWLPRRVARAAARPQAGSAGDRRHLRRRRALRGHARALKAGSTFRTSPPSWSRRAWSIPSRATRGSPGTSTRPARSSPAARQNVDAYGSEAPVTPTIFELLRKEHGLPPEEAWVIATNKSFGLMGGSKLRDFGDPFSANVILPKQLLIETIKSAVSTDAGPGVEDRQALAEQMMLALDEGYEGFGWRVFESGRALGKDLKATLAKSLLDYFNDPTVPTSGDELTFFMTKEIMNRLAPSLLVVNFWDIDIAHYGAYSLYLEAIRRTDRLVHELWQHVQSLPRLPRSHDAPRRARAGQRQRRGRQRVRQPSQRRRLVPPRLAGRARRRRAEGRGHRAPDPHLRRRPNRRAHPRLQDARVRGHGRSASSPSEAHACSSTPGSTGEAAALARDARRGAAPAAGDGPRLHPRRAAEVGRRCSPPSSATSARCSSICRGVPAADLVQLSAGHRQGRRRGGPEQDRRARSRRVSRITPRRRCGSRASCPRGGGRSICSSSRSIRCSRRGSIRRMRRAARRPAVRRRHRGAARQAVDPVQGAGHADPAHARRREEPRWLSARALRRGSGISNGSLFGRLQDDAAFAATDAGSSSPTGAARSRAADARRPSPSPSREPRAPSPEPRPCH